MDRLRYVDRVGEHLRMPDDRRDDVLDEIEAHLDDAIQQLMDEGLSMQQAEREAMARLGSPEELGDELRRTHQSTRRLLAAVGGSVWPGFKAGLTGYLVGGILLAPAVFIIGGFVTEIVRQLTDTPAPTAREQFLVFVPAALAVAAWFAARAVVDAIGERSWRAPRDVATGVAVGGGALVLAAVLLVPMEQTWTGVIATLAIPVAFVAGALSAGRAPALGTRLRDRLPAPGPRRTLLILAVMLGGPALIAATSLAADALTRPDAAPPGLGSAADDWTAKGFDAVAEDQVVPRERVLWAGYPSEGWTVAELPTDEVDWDAWPGLRIEAWRSTSSWGGSDPRLVRTEEGPYVTVPVEDPWTTPRYAVEVGKPGVGSYLLFLVSEDPETGRRTVIGHPDGDDALFHGNLIEWFAAL